MVLLIKVNEVYLRASGLLLGTGNIFTAMTVFVKQMLYGTLFHKYSHGSKNISVPSK